MNNFEIIGLFAMVVCSLFAGFCAFGAILLTERFGRVAGWKAATRGAGLWAVFSALLIVLVPVMSARRVSGMAVCGR
jgi:uncharacterized membrane protein YagU involved in acid resistance